MGDCLGSAWVFLPLFPSLIKLSLSQPASFLAFASVLLEKGRERASSCVSAQRLARVNPQQLVTIFSKSVTILSFHHHYLAVNLLQQIRDLGLNSKFERQIIVSSRLI